MDLMKQNQYQLVTDNPTIVILVERLNKVYEAIDNNMDALHQVTSLISSIPESLDTDLNALIVKTNKEIELKTKVDEDFIKTKGDWSAAHKDEYYQNKCKEYNTQLYQLICKKVSSIIDKLYREELSRKKISPEVLGYGRK